jgi:hypothetical protein
MSRRNNLGPDPSQWSSAKMTGVGLTIAGGVAVAFGGVLINLIDRRRRPVRYVSAKEIRLADERVMAADLAIMEMRLKRAQTQRNEAETSAAEARADLAQERLYGIKDHR